MKSTKQQSHQATSSQTSTIPNTIQDKQGKKTSQAHAVHPNDASYVARNEESQLMKSTIMNQSLNGTHLEILDFDDGPKEHTIDPTRANNFLPTEENIAINLKSTTSAIVGTSYQQNRFKLDSGRKGQWDMINFEPTITNETPNMVKTNQPKTFPARDGRRESDSQHMEYQFYAYSRERLKLRPENFDVRASLKSEFSQRGSQRGGRMQKQESIESIQMQHDDGGVEQEEQKTHKIVKPEKKERRNSHSNKRKNHEKNIVDKSREEVEHKEDRRHTDSERNKGNKKRESQNNNKSEVWLEEKKEDEKKSEKVSSHKSISSKGEKTCKICLDTTEDASSGPFVNPCRCAGSMGNIHEKCLKTWIEAKHADPRKAACELCHTRYQMKFIYRYMFCPKRAIGEGAVSFISGFCLFGMIVGLSALVLSLLLSSDMNTSSSPRDPSDPPPANQSTVKIFISLVCGIFIVILLFLLFFAWREAFFAKKMARWKIENYNSQLQLTVPREHTSSNQQQRDEEEEEASDYRSNSAHSIIDFDANYRPPSDRSSIAAGIQNPPQQAEMEMNRDIPPSRPGSTKSVRHQDTHNENVTEMNLPSTTNLMKKKRLGEVEWEIRKSDSLERGHLEKVTRKKSRNSVGERPTERSDLRGKERQKMLEMLGFGNEGGSLVFGERHRHGDQEEEHKKKDHKRKKRHSVHEARRKTSEEEREREEDIERRKAGEHGVPIKPSSFKPNVAQKRRLSQPEVGAI